VRPIPASESLDHAAKKFMNIIKEQSRNIAGQTHKNTSNILCYEKIAKQHHSCWSIRRMSMFERITKRATIRHAQAL